MGPCEGHEFVRVLIGLDQCRVRPDREPARAADPEHAVDVRPPEFLDEIGGQVREYVNLVVFTRAERRGDGIVTRCEYRYLVRIGYVVGDGLEVG